MTWKRRWKAAAVSKKAIIWKSLWPLQTVALYEDLPKYIATAAFLLRVEVIGLNAWLHSVGVSDVLPRCSCGWSVQTVRHIMLYCPQYSLQRDSLFEQTDFSDITAILSHSRGAQTTGR